MTHTTQTDGIRRREIGRRAIQIGTATVLAPPAINVATADTASGSVELTTTATIPTSTSIEITVFEDTNGDGSASRQENVTIADGTNTYEMGLLQSSTAQGDVLWLQVDLSTTDDTTTPSLDSATLTLPATPQTPTQEPVSQPDDPNTLGELWQNYLAVVGFITAAFALIGAWSRSLTVAAWSGYMAFLYIAFTTGTPLLRNIGIITLVLVFLGMAFKLIASEFEVE